MKKVISTSAKVILKIIVLLFIIVTLIGITSTLYGLTLRGAFGNPLTDGQKISHAMGSPFESSHERAPYALIVSLNRDKKIDLSQELADFGAPDIGYNKGKYFILFPPGASLLAYPFYVAGLQYNAAQLATYASVALYGVGVIIVLFLITTQIFKLPSWAGIISSFLFAFGTTSWSYAITIYQHMPTTFFFLLAFYATWKYRQNSKISGIWAAVVWFCYGAGLYLDLPNLLLFAPVMIYFFVSSVDITTLKEKTKLSFRLVFAITSVVFFALVALHGYYNIISFGDWKKFGQSTTRYIDQEKLEERLQREASASATLQPKKSSGLTSILREERTANGFYRLTVAPDKGVFFFSPVLILGLLGIFAIRKKIKIEHGVLIAVALTNLFIYASFSDPWGGWAYGPRYLIPAMSILSLFTLIFITKGRLQWIKRVVFFILFAFSSAIALLGVLTTNTIPPEVEAVPLGVPYNYLLNLDLLNKGQTGNFVLNTYLSQSVTLSQYYAVIYSFLLAFTFVVLFVGPIFSKNHEN